MGAEDLERDGAPQPRVDGAEDLALRAFPETVGLGLELEVAELELLELLLDVAELLEDWLLLEALDCELELDDELEELTLELGEDDELLLLEDELLLELLELELVSSSCRAGIQTL